MLIDLVGVQKVLIIKVSSIGDVVHALPVSAALKRSFPHLQLGWVVEDMSAEIVQGNPYLEEIFVIPRRRWKPKRFGPAIWGEAYRLIRALRAKRYEVALDLQGLLKSALWAVFSGARVRIGYHRLQEGTHLLLRRVPRRPESLHVVDQYLDVARALGAQVEPVEFPLHIPEEAHQSACQLLKSEGIDPASPFLVVNPSAGREWKRWSLDRFATLSDRIEKEWGLPVLFVGGKGDVPLEESLRTLKQVPLRSLIGRTNLKQLMAVLARCALHLCGDTGSAHLASALKVPCVALFGPTDPDRTGPYGQQERVLCKRQECRRCPAGTCRYLECLQWITVEEVLTRIDQVLGSAYAQHVSNPVRD